MEIEQESPFAFHEGGSRESEGHGMPRHRFMVRSGEKSMRKSYSQEEDSKEEYEGKRKE